MFILIVFLGYAYEFFSLKETWGFPYSDPLSSGEEIRISKQWYIAVLFDKLRYVILSWALWFYAIPRSQTIVKLGAAIFCVKLTFVPINWMLFYMAPFKEERFLLMVILSIIIGLTITHFNGGIWRNNTHSGNS